MLKIIKIFFLIFSCFLPLASCGISIKAEEGIVEDGVAAPRICVVGTGNNAKLMLTKDPKNYGVFFQFASVIAYKSTGGDPIVEFNPSNRPDLWDDKWTVGDTYPMHTVGNLKVGKGDACRLVGFTVAEIKQAIKDKADSDTAPDNGKWRTPTKDENAIFTSIRSEWIENLDGVFNLNGYFFGPGASVGGTGGEFIPAAGCGVFYCGALEGYGSIGCYWSDMPKNINKYGCSLAFRSYFVNPDGTNRQSTGYYIRCVRQ